MTTALMIFRGVGAELVPPEWLVLPWGSSMYEVWPSGVRGIGGRGFAVKVATNLWMAWGLTADQCQCVARAVASWTLPELRTATDAVSATAQNDWLAAQAALNTELPPPTLPSEIQIPCAVWGHPMELEAENPDPVTVALGSRANGVAEGWLAANVDQVDATRAAEMLSAWGLPGVWNTLLLSHDQLTTLPGVNLATADAIKASFIGAL